MTQDEWIEELVAQIESHGASKVVFSLADDDNLKELTIENCQFEGTFVLVKLTIA